MPVANLEIFLFRRDAGNASVSYGIKLRFAAAGSENEKAASGTTPLHADDPEFRARSLDPAAYGSYLADRLLAEPAIRSFFDQARTAAQAQDTSLHIRLVIGADAAELHSLRWETLRLPGATSALLTGENLTFSRYLDSSDWRPVVRPRSAADIRALIVIADPSDAARFKLAPVKKEQELAAARAGLGDIPAVELATRGQVTLNNIVAPLRDGCDILYLVAHGMLVDGEPWLFLEKEDGTGEWVAGSALATRIQELDDRPRLAVLVSCQGAGTGEAEPASREDGAHTTSSPLPSVGDFAGPARAGAGPRLAEAGVPAVIAMQGNVTMQTAAAFMPVFLRELRRDGLADRAMAVARGAVRDRPDWWMPVLFTGLRSGRIWEPAGPDARPEIPRQPFEPETVYVPAGPFLMGHAQGSGAPAWEMPLQALTLPDYHIGKYPVTNAQYLAFARDKRIAVAPEAGWELAAVGQAPPPGRENHPMVGITWDDAVAYCGWLSNKTGRHYRLPSEAEWEKAASWGTEADKETGRQVNKERKRRYPWGDTFDATKCNTAESGIGTTTAVGTYSDKGGDSPCGAADMAGNVWEWTSTRWGTERSQPQYASPYDPGDGRENQDKDEPFREYRIVRGGSYQDGADRAICTARGRDAADKGSPRRGFRVAMDI